MYISHDYARCVGPALEMDSLIKIVLTVKTFLNTNVNIVVQSLCGFASAQLIFATNVIRGVLLRQNHALLLVRFSSRKVLPAP